MEASSLNIPINADNAIVWHDERLLLLDQRVLPEKAEFIGFDTPQLAAEAIRQMVVRGAPAIGITAAYGVVLAARLRAAASPTAWKVGLKEDMELLAQSRPTAVNLFWALARMQGVIDTLNETDDPVSRLLEEAKAIHQEDIAANRKMGELGAGLIEEATQVITHCNAGALATGGYGTALGVVRSGHAAGKISQVCADETRPWMQGSRLTAWELQQDNIPVTLLVEGAAASLLAQGDVGWVIVGSDRIAANGDVANKIGTYTLAVAAKYHGVKVMVVAPTSTIDMSLSSGRDIPIESRDPAEVLSFGGKQIGAEGVGAWNPVFDVTPAALVDAIVTEKGVVRSPDSKKMAELMA
ncbi:MAG: S-methyl-5-thioribose-1-phosphate isomerase [Chromatiales bacterium]|nr:S-methyl-5-thioribose-1-phosphate isomerase [Chromatiales bacterium]